MDTAYVQSSEKKLCDNCVVLDEFIDYVRWSILLKIRLANQS